MNQIINKLKKVKYILDAPQQKVIALVLVLSIIGSFLEMLGVSIIVPLVRVMLDTDAMMNSNLVQSIGFLRNATYETLVILIGIGVIAVYSVKNLYFVFLSWVRVKCSCKIQREVSITILSSYMTRGYQFFLKRSYGELQRGIVGDASVLYTFIYAVFRIVSEILTIMLIIVYMCFADWQMALAMIVLSGVCLAFINYVFRKRMYQAGIELRKYSAKCGQAILQAVHGIKDVLVMQKQEYFIDSYRMNKKEEQKATVQQTVGAEIPAYIVEGVCVVGLLVVVCFKIISMEDNVAFIAVLASFAVGAFRVLPSLGKISSALNSATASWPSVESLYKNMKVVREMKHVQIIDRHSKASFEKNLKIEDVSFCYNKENGDVLESITLDIKKGTSVAFIGESGAGKSTLVDIILGLLIPQRGKILLDGVNVGSIPKTWAKLVGYVPQAVFLANTSVMQNIAYGEREIDEEKVWLAIEKAKLTQFVRELPDGLETQVGDRGVRLSGGQRQRIAIARALYHEPEIMVLDEATSALDNDTEQAVMEAIDSLQGKITLIIIAHRLTTIRNCDRIYEVSNKGLIEKDKREIQFS